MATEVTIRLGGQVWPGLRPHTDEHGVTWGFEELEGWWDETDTTGDVEQREYQHGGVPGPAFSRSRVIVVKGHAWAETRSKLRAGLARAQAAAPIDRLTPFVVEDDGETWHAYVRRDKRPIIDWSAGGLEASWDLQFIAPDHRKFGGNGAGYQYSVDTPLPSTTGGLVAPWTAPLLSDAVTVPGRIRVASQGTAAPAVVGLITGPVVNPFLYTTDGQGQRFMLDLDAGEQLFIDFTRRRVELGGEGGPSRRGKMVGRWIEFDQAGTTVEFSADSGTQAARLRLSWSDATK